MTQEDDGYATDIPYLRDFKPMLAPAWLDHVALVAGIVHDGVETVAGLKRAMRDARIPVRMVA